MIRKHEARYIVRSQSTSAERQLLNLFPASGRYRFEGSSCMSPHRGLRATSAFCFMRRTIIFLLDLESEHNAIATYRDTRVPRIRFSRGGTTIHYHVSSLGGWRSQLSAVPTTEDRYRNSFATWMAENQQICRLHQEMVRGLP